MFEYVKFPVLPIVRNHMIINTIITALAVLIVGLRLMARYLSGAKLWWDDYLILLSVPQGIGMLIIQGMCKFTLWNISRTPFLFTDSFQGWTWASDSQSQRQCPTS